MKNLFLFSFVNVYNSVLKPDIRPNDLNVITSPLLSLQLLFVGIFNSYVEMDRFPKSWRAFSMHSTTIMKPWCMMKDSVEIVHSNIVCAVVSAIYVFNVKSKAVRSIEWLDIVELCLIDNSWRYETITSISFILKCFFQTKVQNLQENGNLSEIIFCSFS